MSSAPTLRLQWWIAALLIRVDALEKLIADPRAAHRQKQPMTRCPAAHIASGKRTINPSRFGMRTLGNVSAFIVSLSPMSLFSARISAVNA